jgi:ribosomal protein L11 methyltransferase
MNETDAAIWTEASVRVSQEAIEPVAEVLQEVTGAGVSIEPPIEALGPDEGYLLDEHEPYTLRGYFYGPVARTRRDGVRRRLHRAGLSTYLRGRIAWRTLREIDWAEAWKEHYQVERVGRIVIRPAWREYSAGRGEAVVSLDPGMAFGTGQHPTTRMCLLALQDLVKPGDRVLDLGAGSGVLALAAVALGAKNAVCIDVEEQAVAASTANAALNGMSERVHVTPAGSIEQAAGHGPFDLVLANIIARVIIALAPQMRAEMKPGAALVTSGIIAEREAETLAALEQAGLTLERRLEEGDWRAFVHRRPA